MPITSLTKTRKMKKIFFEVTFVVSLFATLMMFFVNLKHMNMLFVFCLCLFICVFSYKRLDEDDIEELTCKFENILDIDLHSED